MLLAARRPVVIDQLEVFLGEILRQFLGIGNGGRAADELRLRAVECRNALEAAQHVGKVAPEHSAISVQLVDDDVAQVLEEARPARVMGQHPGVQHVRVAEHDVGAPADRAPGV